MPLGPKLVFALLIVGLASGMFWFFLGLNTKIGHVLGIVIDIALLTGLYTRQTVAWFTARWLTAIGASIMSVAFVLVVMSGTTKFWILAIVAIELALSWWFFALLGRADSRTYFNAPRKA
jgi:hypothetical protein